MLSSTRGVTDIGAIINAAGKIVGFHIQGCVRKPCQADVTPAHPGLRPIRAIRVPRVPYLTVT
jgi:hypothetical protein